MAVTFGTLSPLQYWHAMSNTSSIFIYKSNFDQGNFGSGIIDRPDGHWLELRLQAKNRSIEDLTRGQCTYIFSWSNILGHQFHKCDRFGGHQHDYWLLHRPKRLMFSGHTMLMVLYQFCRLCTDQADVPCFAQRETMRSKHHKRSPELRNHLEYFNGKIISSPDCFTLIGLHGLFSILSHNYVESHNARKYDQELPM